METQTLILAFFVLCGAGIMLTMLTPGTVVSEGAGLVGSPLRSRFCGAAERSC